MVINSSIPAGNFIAKFDVQRHMISPKSIIEIPISIVEDVYDFNQVNIDTLTLELQYPFNALDLREITTIQNGTKISTVDEKGNLRLELTKIGGGAFQLNENRIATLKFFVLDALPNEYRLDFKSGSVVSFPGMTIETEDSSFVIINENCVNTIEYDFVKPINLDYLITNSSLSIRLEQPTDDIYKLNIFDINGRSIVNILDGTQSKGEYFQKISLNEINSGVYFIVLEYPNNIISKSINIIK